MAQINIPRTNQITTHEGATAKQINVEQQLRRSVLACLLWEDQFYESGVEVASRIAELVPKVPPMKVVLLAEEARDKMKLRHVPLLLAREMARHDTHKGFVSSLLEHIIQRPDELSEFVALYWKAGKCPLSGQVKKGLAKAFVKFDAYQLAKYNRDRDVKLRDVLFLCHAKPNSIEQQTTWKALIDGTLAPPDTWEVGLSSGRDKRVVWEELLTKRKLGAMALLRNLRNMSEVGVTERLVQRGLEHLSTQRILPFRFISAAYAVPQWEHWIEPVMLRCMENHEKLSGHTVLLLDVSGSMNDSITYKSDITRLDVACGLAMLAREICEKVDVFTFSMEFVRIPARRGFALRDVIVNSQIHSGTPLGLAVKTIYADSKFSQDTVDLGFYGVRSVKGYRGQNLSPDRLIVFTDEQSHDSVPDPRGKGYMINVARCKNGVGYYKWNHIDGWSESIIDYIQEAEKLVLN